MKKNLPVSLLLVIFFVLVITSVSTKSPVCDAAAHHIAAACSYVKTADFRMNPSAPPFLRLLMGFPLLGLDLRIPTDHPSWQTINSTEFSYQLLFVYNDKLAEKIVFLSRLPMIIVSTLLGFLIFAWSKKLYGYNAGLVALFLFVFSPTILGNAGLAMLDMGGASFIFLAIFQLWRYLKDKSTFNLVLTGICFGLAQSTRITAVILYPLFLVFMLAEALLNRKERTFRLSGALKSAVVIWLIGLFVLWGTYFFEFKPLLKNAPDVEEKIEYIRKFANTIPFVDKRGLANLLVYFAKNIPIPLSTYIVTFLGVLKIFTVGMRLVFMGQEIFGGSKIYYLVDYLIKTPLAEILILILSFILIKKRTRTDFSTNLILILPIATFFLVSSFSRLQGGLRYILPVYPFLFVWLSDIANFAQGRIKFKILLSMLGIWYLFSSLMVYPHYLAYFNELVGGPGGFGYKITTDMDWGQDFKALKKYLDKKGIGRVKLHCFGTVEPRHYGINYEWLTDEEFKRPLPGNYYAISSRFLSNVKWTNDYTPIDRVAYTIFIYYIENVKRDCP